MPKKFVNEPLIEFNPKLPKLSKSESKVLKLLVQAGKLIAPIYLEQEKQAKIKIDRQEIEKAAKKDAAILSPYTLIEKINGKLVSTPYHIKYAKLLKPIAEKLGEAAKISDNKAFSKALRVQAKALMDGSYEKATAVWLKLKPYIIDFSIGPLYHFDSQFFFGKASYQSWVGVLDIEGTKRLNNYKSTTLGATRKAIVPGERIENLEKVKAKTIDEVILSGILARSKFVGLNLPMSVDLVEKYGSEVTIFNQVNDLRMKVEIIPNFKKLFLPAFRAGFKHDDLRRGSLRYVALHELAHNYLYYKNSIKNLQDLFPCIYELAATVLGLRMAGTLLLKDRITSKQLESMIVTFICRSFYLLEKSENNKSMVNYALGGVIFINFMVEKGALKHEKGMLVPNFTKIFVSLHELSYKLEYLLSLGKRKDAEAFIQKYGRIHKII